MYNSKNNVNGGIYFSKGTIYFFLLILITPCVFIYNVISLVVDYDHWIASCPKDLLYFYLMLLVFTLLSLYDFSCQHRSFSFKSDAFIVEDFFSFHSREYKYADIKSIDMDIPSYYPKNRGVTIEIYFERRTGNQAKTYRLHNFSFKDVEKSQANLKEKSIHFNSKNRP